jgi:hypothetical protein
MIDHTRWRKVHTWFVGIVAIKRLEQCQLIYRIFVPPGPRRFARRVSSSTVFGDWINVIEGNSREREWYRGLENIAVQVGSLKSSPRC